MKLLKKQIKELGMAEATVRTNKYVAYEVSDKVTEYGWKHVASKIIRVAYSILQNIRKNNEIHKIQD